jgi:hypothetical protein
MRHSRTATSTLPLSQSSTTQILLPRMRIRADESKRTKSTTYASFIPALLVCRSYFITTTGFPKTKQSDLRDLLYECYNTSKMIALAFFSWWYGHGWNEAAHNFTKRFQKVSRAFSVRLLLKTLFSPWRRIISYPGASFGEHLRAWADNLVSRIVGFFVRLLVLVVALISLFVAALVSIVELIIWPLLPPAILACIILGIMR